MAQQRARAQQRQRQRMIMVLILLLVIVAFAAFYFLSGNNDKQQKHKQVAPQGLVRVPTLLINLRPGKRIKNDMIRYVYRKPKEVPTDAVLAPDQFIGRFTSHPILKGQYIREGYVGSEGAVGGYSAMARPGKRLVVLGTKLFPKSINTLRPGDRIDLLALERTRVGAGGNKKPKYNSGAIDGSQPGTGGSRRRSSTGKKGNGAALRDPGTVSATLIAENAEVMSVPRTNRRGRNVSGHTALVLQMEPEDAHVTMLMAASRHTMRAVFRPYGDNERLTLAKPLTATTRLPKPKSDPDVIKVIINGKTYLRKPNSTMYSQEEDSYESDHQPRLIYGHEKASVTETNDQISEDGINNETSSKG